MVTFYVFTIFPKLLESFCEESLIKKAQQKKLLKIKIVDLRNFGWGKRKIIDDRPFGGGIGMVMRVEPFFEALKKNLKFKISKKKIKVKKDTEIIFLSPRGEIFSQKLAWQLSKKKNIAFLCGRYEGIDERVAKNLSTKMISLGNFVTMGGEVAAMAIIEAVSRLIPGVLGKPQLLTERKEGEGFVEYPQYTRPAVFSPKKGIFWKVPKVLLSGNHKLIAEWRKKHQKIIE